MLSLVVLLGLPATAAAGPRGSPALTATSTTVATLPGGHVSHVQAPDLGTLSSVSWSASSTTPGATGVTYSYGFSIPVLSLSINSVTLTVPPGTTGTPVMSVISGLPAGGTLTLNTTTNTLTYSGFTQLLTVLDTVSMTITGMTNTPTGGTYSSTVTVLYNGTSEGAGTSTALSFVGPLLLTPPTALSWSATITASSHSVVDTATAQQQFGVYDNTGSGAGWNVTMSATSFVSGSHTLPSGVVTVTGSTASVTSTASPTTACAISGCTLPTNAIAYPVQVTAGNSTATKIFDTAASTGLGSITVAPVGWWVTVLPTAATGTYTSTITFSVVSGP
jgi:hypothetical protein